MTYTPADGKKRFPGKVTRLGDIVNIPVEIHDYETLDTKFGEDRYLVSFKNPATQEWGKFFTASDEMKGILDQIATSRMAFRLRPSSSANSLTAASESITSHKATH